MWSRGLSLEQALLIVGAALATTFTVVMHQRQKVEDNCHKGGYSDVMETPTGDLYCVRWHGVKGELIKYEDLK